MEVRITGRHGAAPDDVKDYVTEKLEPLSRYNGHAHTLEVVLDADHLSKSIEVIAHLRKGAPVVVKAGAPDARTAVDLAHDKLERVLRKLKERRTDRRPPRGAVIPGQPAMVEDEDEDYDTGEIGEEE